MKKNNSACIEALLQLGPALDYIKSLSSDDLLRFWLLSSRKMDVLIDEFIAKDPSRKEDFLTALGGSQTCGLALWSVISRTREGPIPSGTQCRRG